MQMEITQVLKDIKFFTDAVRVVAFANEQRGGFGENRFPSVAEWTKGWILLTPNDSEYYKNTIKERLAAYGIQITEEKGLVKFPATAGDDIIFVLNKVMQDKKMQNQVHNLEYDLKGLTQNIDPLIQQLPHVESSVFSRGVKAMKNQVEVLKNIRETQKQR